MVYMKILYVKLLLCIKGISGKNFCEARYYECSKRFIQAC